MKRLKIFIILLFLIVSMGFVSAQDNLNDTLETDVPVIEELGSFEELNNEINSTNGTLEITKDYRNDNYSNGIKLVRDNFTINGNDHVLDGNNHAIFLIKGSNITINNLIFSNAYYKGAGAAIYNDGTLILNNVTFINNNAMGGAAIYNLGTTILNNVTFINNSVLNHGGAIFNGGVMDVGHAVFVNNSANVSGAIYNRGVMDVEDAVFVNNSANVSGAICNGGVMDVGHAVFVNNSAVLSAGAVYSGVDITLCDVTFMNNSAMDYGGAIFNEGVMDVGHAVFVNNSAMDYGGAIYNNGGHVNLCEGAFVNNNASNGGAMYYLGAVSCVKFKFIDNAASKFGGNAIGGIYAPIIIDDCSFESKYVNEGGFVYLVNSSLTVNNSIFANSTSEYAPAIYVTGGNLSINGSRFINLKAGQSAGAVFVKKFANFTVENSVFVNTSSAKNGGAIFADAMVFDTGGEEGLMDSPDVGEYLADIFIGNVSFINASGNFGGAFVLLGGNLTVSGLKAINCSSKYDGGVLYLSNVDAKIYNSTFISNNVATHIGYPTYGGAIYFDYGNLTVNNSKFINNSAFAGSGVVAVYDCLYYIANSTFDNDGESVHATFKRDGSYVADCSGNNVISDENVFYIQVISDSGMNLTWISNEINCNNLPVRFDLRDFNWVSSVKNQGMMGSCWTFAAIAVLESALLKSTGLNIDLSENNLQDLMLRYSKYGDFVAEGGYNLLAMGYFLSWFGAVPEEYDTYDQVAKISPVISSGEKIHLQDFVIIPRDPDAINGDVNVKRAIIKYGALLTNIFSDTMLYQSSYYNLSAAAYYDSNYDNPNHAICLVGWDDTFSRENFAITPPGDGAWICKNSAGNESGDNGYFYVSYYDKSFSSNPEEYRRCAVAVIFENNVSYNRNYQHDFTGLGGFYHNASQNQVTYANSFTAVGDDLIAAVGTYFNQEGVNYTIKIKVNGELALTQSGVSPYLGYHTIRLDNYLQIKKGDEFAVYITSNAVPHSNCTRLYHEDGVSMTDCWGSWTDLYAENKTVACIKAYTVSDDSKIIANKDISLDYSGGKCFSVNVATSDGHAVAGAFVKFNVNDRLKTVKTDEKGVAKIKIDEGPGKYTVKTTYNGKTYTNKVTVKHVLTASKVTVKKTAKKFTLKAKLKINGKLVKGKWITFKFAGKTYKVKTNSKGVAQKTLNKNVIKKLKNGKTYTVKVTYLKDTIKTTVKVK